MKSRLLAFLIGIALLVPILNINSYAYSTAAMDRNSILAAGGSGSVAVIDENNNLLMWGSNSHGQLGNGLKGNSGSVEDMEFGYMGYYELYQTVPQKVLENVKDVAVGYMSNGNLPLKIFACIVEVHVTFHGIA